MNYIINMSNLNLFFKTHKPHKEYIKASVKMLLLGASVVCNSSLYAQKNKFNMNKFNLNIEQLKGFPFSEIGIEKGVSAPFAGCSNGFIVMAGGCNFPDKPVAEGGKKRFYSGIYAAFDNGSDSLSWKLIGHLPKEVAYGVAINANENNIILVGGANTNGSLNSVFSISLNVDGQLNSIKTFPSLPIALDNMAGTIINSTIYIVGGLCNGVPSKAVFALNINEPENEWQQIDNLPSMPRVQPVCANVNNQLAVFGGFFGGDNSQQAEVFVDGIIYDKQKKQWNNIGLVGSDNETDCITTTGGVALNINNNIVAYAGGVNKHLFLDAISGKYQLVKKENYLLKPVDWYKFNSFLYLFDCKQKVWHKTSLNSPLLARAGAAMILLSNKIYYIGGELKPGIRANIVSRISL